MRRYFIFLLLSAIVVSCRNNESLFCGKLVPVETFEKEYHLVGSMEQIDTIGAFQIDFSAPYLIITQYKLPYFIKVYDSKTRNIRANLAHRGEGPNEFLSFSILNQQHDSILWTQDYHKKKLLGIDLQKSIEQKTNVVRKSIDYKKINDPLQVFYCNDSLLLIKNIEHELGVQYVKFNPFCPDGNMTRFFMYNPILLQQDLNLMMSLADCLKPDGKMIACLTGVLNQIDILNLEDSTQNFSVKMGDGPTSIEDIRQNRETLYDYYISIPRCNDSLIFALYCNKEENGKKEFHVINWEGKALFKLFINEDLRDFNIDWQNGKLYGITNNDIVYVYDVNNIVKT